MVLCTFQCMIHNIYFILFFSYTSRLKKFPSNPSLLSAWEVLFLTHIFSIHFIYYLYWWSDCPTFDKRDCLQYGTFDRTLLVLNCFLAIWYDQMLQGHIVHFFFPLFLLAYFLFFSEHITLNCFLRNVHRKYIFWIFICLLIDNLLIFTLVGYRFLF